MKIIDYLRQLGYEDEYIYQLFDEGKLIQTKDGVSFSDYNYLIYIIKNYNSIYQLFDYHNENINNMFNYLFDLIRMDQNKLAYELAKRLNDIFPTPELNLIIHNIDHSIDNINYIVDERAYTNDVVLNGFKKYERDMLLDFITNDTKKGNQELLKLAKLYVYQNPSPFIAYKAYLSGIVELKENHLKGNTRKLEGALGEPTSVIAALIKCGDYIRAHEVLNDIYIKKRKNEFSIIFEIYMIFDKELMDILHENMEHIYNNIKANANGYNNVKDIVKNYELPKFDAALIDSMYKKDDYSIDYDKDYYNEYLKHKEEGSYEQARMDIIKYQRLLGERGIFCDFDYLIKETEILIFNANEQTQEEKEKHDSLIDKANYKKNTNMFEEAIELYKQALKCEKKQNPLLLAKIAECYIELEDYMNAAYYYSQEEQDYLYPIDYLHYIECLYRINNYEKIFDLAQGYEYYYPSESSFIHYILSICYINENNYKAALNEIDTCEIISMEYYDLALNFNYERAIIKDLENGKEVECYTLNDYYDHCITDAFKSKISELDIDSLPEDGSLLYKIINSNSNENLISTIDFYLKLAKVLKEMERYQDAKELLSYVEEIIATSQLSPTDEEHFTLVLKNYRNL